MKRRVQNSPESKAHKSEAEALVNISAEDCLKKNQNLSGRGWWIVKDRTPQARVITQEMTSGSRKIYRLLDLQQQKLYYILDPSPRSHPRQRRSLSAVCKDGVLTVTVEKLPPPEPKKPKTIEVKVA